jgi:hypothetical protein
MDVQKKYKMTNSEGNSAGAGGALVSCPRRNAQCGATKFFAKKRAF